MFTANREPEADRQQIDTLIERLEGVRTQRFVLISTIAVLADLAAGDDESTKAFQEDLAYGRNRRILEAFCETHFDDYLVVRLPALFGPGLRKNFIFDLLNPAPTMLTQARLAMLLERVPLVFRDVLARLYGPHTAGMYLLDRDALNAHPCRPAVDAAVQEAELSATQFHNPDTTYQYYDMSRLWRDISVATEFALRHVHLVTEPLRAGDIYVRLMGTDMPQTGAKLHHEDMRTRHAALWEREGPYLEDASTVLDRLEEFFAVQERVV